MTCFSCSSYVSQVVVCPLVNTFYRMHLSLHTASWAQERVRRNLGLPNTTMVTKKGTLAPVGCPDFNQYLVQRLHNRHMVRPQPPADSRGYGKTVRVPSASSQRARLGFKYWIDDNAKTKSRAKSGMRYDFDLLFNGAVI